MDCEGNIFKYLQGILMVVLLTHVCCGNSQITSNGTTPTATIDTNVTSTTIDTTTPTGTIDINATSSTIDTTTPTATIDTNATSTTIDTTTQTASIDTNATTSTINTTTTTTTTIDTNATSNTITTPTTTIDTNATSNTTTTPTTTIDTNATSTTIDITTPTATINTNATSTTIDTTTPTATIDTNATSTTIDTTTPTATIYTNATTTLTATIDTNATSSTTNTTTPTATIDTNATSSTINTTTPTNTSTTLNANGNLNTSTIYTTTTININAPYNTSTFNTPTPTSTINTTSTSTTTFSTTINNTTYMTTPSILINTTYNTSTNTLTTISTNIPYSTTFNTSTITSPPVTTLLQATTTHMTATVIGMLLKISQTFDTSLADPSNPNYKYLSGIISSTVDSNYSTYLKGYISKSAGVIGFRSGSILADYKISATSNSLDFAAANTALSSSLKAQGINVAEDAFAQSDQKDFTTVQVYPLQKLDLNCIQPDFATGQIKWAVDNKDPALDNTRYLLSNNNSTLTVKNVSESDSGQYSCIIQRSTVPYIQWQSIVIKQRPSIIVGDNYRIFPCDGSSVLLRCSVDAGYNIEWVLRGIVQISGSNSITLNYATQSGNCTEETFTCRLKDLPQLLAYSYSQSSVTVRTSTERYDCQNEELGLGKINDERNGICRAGTKGTITYRCDSGGWTSVQENCILDVIDQLLTQVQTLRVEQISNYMANLSFATEENNINITQSSATVRAVVDILFKIADLSQAAVINQIVMEDFLNIVDIIVSDNTSETWTKLSNSNNTENTNVRLLNATENISDRITDEFTINQTFIQLRRTTVKNNSFSLTSTLPNSTTQIVIPQIPQETNITIIIFTTLDNVLPTRNTNDGSGKPNVRINGDVVVVKVNETLNNISFAFDINDQSLGNPQCVFWNFDLNAWDSTGCKVKPVGNDTGIITCECNHTTSFSILMSPFSINHTALDYITYIGVTISMACLVICLIIEAIVWKSVRRNDTSYMRHVSVVNIAVSLLIANICFIIGASISEEKPTPVARCSPAVFFMHFFYLALFFWMLTSALFLLYRTVMVLSQMSRTRMMAVAFIVGYCAPLLIAVITVASTAGPQNYVSKQACWLNWDESKALLAFVIPALTIVAINLVVLLVVLYKLLRQRTGVATQADEKHTLFVIVRCVAVLTPLFGLTWGFGIGTMVSRELGIHVVFTILNSLQGLFILVFGTVLDNKVRESLPGIQKLSSSHTKSTSGGTSSTSGLTFFQRMRRRHVYHVSEVNSSSAVTTSQSTSSSYNIVNN